MKSKTLLFLLSLFPVMCFAEKTCEGGISNIHLDKHGNLYATVVSDNSTVQLYDSKFCNLSGTEHHFTSESCKGLMALFLSAQARNSLVRIWFSDDNHTCKGNWAGLENQGFYHAALMN